MHPALRPAVFVLLTPLMLAAQQPAPTQASQAPNSDTSYIDAQGTAHITRVVPVPTTISPEAQKMLARAMPDQAPPESLAERRAQMVTYTAVGRIAWTKICPNQIVEDEIAGVPVRIVTPDGMPAENRNKVLLNLHGGGFNSDSGSYQESIPIASYTGVKVVAVLYRLAPEHPFPAAVDDAVAVYRELLKAYSPKHIVIYGTSAGAILTGEVAVKLKQLGLPMPAALGIFSGMGDFARDGDSAAMYTLSGLSGHLDPPGSGPHDSEYVGSTDPRDRFFRLSMPICTACRLRSSSPANAICCSAEQRIYTAPFCTPALTRAWWFSTRSLTASGITRNCLRRSRPTTSWPASLSKS